MGAFFKRRASILGLALALGGAGCGNRGSVTFTVHAPTLKLLDPLADPRISEFLVKASDGSLVGAATQTAGASDLPLGPLMARDTPTDMTLDVLAGTELLGLARVRDVMVQPGMQVSYTAELRKPFAIVGSRLPDEMLPMNRVLKTELLDPSTAADVAPQLESSPAPATLPLGVAAAQASSDGRWLFAATIPASPLPPELQIVDTATGQTLGQLPLQLPPARVVVAPRDAALAVVADGTPGGAGAIQLYPDVNSFVGGAQTPITVSIKAGAVRQAVFSADATQLYVLTGDPHALDPCGKPPGTPNQVLAYGLDGTLQQRFSLPSWAADLAVDDASGQLVVSLPTANQVAVLQITGDGTSVTARPLISDAICPTALDVENGLVHVITATPDVQAGVPSYQLRRIALDGSGASSIPFPQPVYQAAVNESDPKDGKISFDLKVMPKFFDGYEIAVAPDGSRVQFATRAHYVETSDQLFDLIQGFVCQPTLDIVEYGVYSTDTRNQTSSYVSRSQIVTSPSSTQPCILCTNGIFEVDFKCPSVAGDRPAGLATLFGQP